MSASTIMLTNPGPSLNAILLRKRPPYGFADFAPVIYVASAPVIAVANAKFPPNDMKELIALARSHPGKVTWGSSGTGSNPHAALETLKSVTGMKGVSLTPMAGAQGELAGVAMIRAYHVANELNLDFEDRLKFVELDREKKELFLMNRLKFQKHVLSQAEKARDVFHLN